MIPGKYSGLVTCFAAAGMGMFVALWLLDFAIIRASWFHDSSAVTAKDWISALSGWAAAIGAIIAAIMTITKLREQINEQKKQTDFLVGDAMPTIDCIQDIKDPEQIVLRVVNWNRRTIMISAIGAENIDKKNMKFGILEIKQNGEVIKNPADQPIIQGWEQRNNAPQSVKIKITVTSNNTLWREFPNDMIIKVMLKLIDQSHDIIVLKCYLHPRT